ncbi:hypothetical protein NDU88_005978 [Pleurodeles waltl]|uniref:Uncharacterized protein n=1 Tax=Pleurodeles waltl TaxID=8319 RepID=A0AAV7RNB0_PLEWA|nr:hypothetical protein NDU88_005978 [Pleurodeles waltl]
MSLGGRGVMLLQMPEVCSCDGPGANAGGQAGGRPLVAPRRSDWEALIRRGRHSRAAVAAKSSHGGGWQSSSGSRGVRNG